MDEKNPSTHSKVREMEREKGSNASHLDHVLTNNEVQQDPEYKLGWRSFLAITALALGNCCAALSGTVGLGRLHTTT